MKENGYEMKRYGYPVKRYCQTMDLKDDPELIEKYRECHSKEKSWREIREGIRSVGILEMEIYICGNRLFMIVEIRDRSKLLLISIGNLLWLNLRLYPDSRNGKILYRYSNNAGKGNLLKKNGV